MICKKKKENKWREAYQNSPSMNPVLGYCRRTIGSSCNSMPLLAYLFSIIKKMKRSKERNQRRKKKEESRSDKKKTKKIYHTLNGVPTKTYPVILLAHPPIEMKLVKITKRKRKLRERKDAETRRIQKERRITAYHKLPEVDRLN